MNMEKEVWKDVLGYDYKYQISNFGNFRCLNPYKSNLKNINYTKIKDGKGYFKYSLTKNKKTKQIFAHRLVAQYFLDDFDSKLSVNHKDFNTENNHYSNLEMASMRDNNYHYLINKCKKMTSSGIIGISYHSGIDKWQVRVNYNNKRYSLGVFKNEFEAIKKLNEFNSNKDKNLFKNGKGKSNIGRKKFSKQEEQNALDLSFKIGIYNASKETGIGTTHISKLRKINKEWNLKNKLTN